MQARFVEGALLVGALALVPCAGTAFAQPPPVAAAPAPRLAAPSTAPHGAVVVAVNDEAGPAAKALAHEVYREPALRPSIDEATARALTGDIAAAPAAPDPAAPPPTAAAEKLAEITALRGSIAASVTDITTRHLLASLGTSLRADLVVAVSLDGGHAVARVLHAGTASFERVELGAGVEVAADGARTFVWPGAATTLRGFLPAPPAPPAIEAPKPAAKPPAELASKPKHELSDQRPVWKSPWFWAALGGVATVGITVFVLSKTTGNTPSTVHLDGSVDP
ncbi:MAG: hypothetical protein ABJE95_36500 [Byssovorax sp.]